MEKASRERNAKAGLKREDAHDRTEWREGVQDDSYEKHPTTSVDRDKTGLKLESSSLLTFILLLILSNNLQTARQFQCNCQAFATFLCHPGWSRTSYATQAGIR